MWSPLSARSRSAPPSSPKYVLLSSHFYRLCNWGVPSSLTCCKSSNPCHGWWIPYWKLCLGKQLSEISMGQCASFLTPSTTQALQREVMWVPKADVWSHTNGGKQFPEWNIVYRYLGPKESRMYTCMPAASDPFFLCLGLTECILAPLHLTNVNIDLAICHHFLWTNSFSLLKHILIL